MRAMQFACASHRRFASAVLICPFIRKPIKLLELLLGMQMVREER